MKSIKVFTIAALLVVISLSGPGIGKAAVALPMTYTKRRFEKTENTLSMCGEKVLILTKLRKPC